MTRSEKKARRLVVGGTVFLWSLSHTHRASGAEYEGCCETLVIRRFKARGRLHIEFHDGLDRFVPDGYLLASGMVGTEGRLLNLHEPGTVRALLDEVLDQGWQPDSPLVHEVDGWTLFKTVATHRTTATAN